MSNMSYCRFQNTYNDLLECYDNINENLNEMSVSELEYRNKLIHLCQKILHEYIESSIEQNSNLTIHLCNCNGQPIIKSNSRYELIEPLVYWVECPKCGKTALFDVQSSIKAAIGQWNSEFIN